MNSFFSASKTFLAKGTEQIQQISVKGAEQLQQQMSSFSATNGSNESKLLHCEYVVQATLSGYNQRPLSATSKK